MAGIRERTDVPGGFLSPSERLSGDLFVPTEPWQDAFAEVLTRPGVIGLGLRMGAGWRQADLSFVADLPPLREVEVIGWWPCAIDLSPLYAHPTLESLIIECDYRKFDFSRLPALQRCRLRWRRDAETILDCTALRFLHCMGFPFPDLSGLARLSALEELRIESRTLRTLRGIEALEQLRHVSLIHCPSLPDISACAGARTLESALIHSCRRVGDIEVLAGLARLQKLVMENSGQVRSVAAFATAPSLETLLLIAIDVQDGNLEPLTRAPRLRKVAVARRRHHSHTSEEIEQALRGRG